MTSMGRFPRANSRPSQSLSLPLQTHVEAIVLINPLDTGATLCCAMVKSRGGMLEFRPGYVVNKEEPLVSLRRRISNAFGLDRGSAEESDSDPVEALANEAQEVAGESRTGESDQANLASQYGVSIEPIIVQQDLERYWKVRGVRHLTPEENEGRHHIFVQAHFAETSQHSDATVRITWEGGSQDFTLEKNQRNSILSFAMFTWQTCNVSMVDAHSELVSGLTANHPDELSERGERTGNTLFHHSFLVEFEEKVVAQKNSRIFGQIVNGADLTLQLLADGQVLGSGEIPQSGAFRFNSVPAGTFVVQVMDPDTDEVVAQSKPISLDGVNAAEINLEVAPPPAAEAETAAEVPPAVAMPTPDDLEGLSKPPVVEPLAPGLVPPAPPPEPVRSQAPATREDNARTVSGYAKSIDHYILFGPREHFATKAYLPLLMSHLLESNATFGFSPEEALHARRVTILASPDVLPVTLEEKFQKHGIEVTRAHGDLERIRSVIRESE